MQFKKEALYKEIKRQNPELDIEYIELLFKSVINGVKEWSRKPTALRLRVRYLGIFYWKHKNLLNDYEHKKFFTDSEKYKRGEEHKNFINVADFILKEYVKLREKKQEIKKINYGADYKTPEELKILIKEKKLAFENNKNNNKISFF